MLPIKLDWPVLAHCDLYTVKRYAEKEFEKTKNARPLSERKFEQHVKIDSN